MAREQRRLAAIVSADVVGYSRLMGRDESGTVARLRRVRTERLEPVLARRDGRVVKLTGDGALIEFASAVEALSAAIEFQQAMTDGEAELAEAERLVFRVGVHLGDVIVDGNDLYGDGINVAARLEAEAPAGGIVISGDMHNFAASRVAATFEDLGRLALKNIERPVQAYAVRWQSNDWPLASPVASPAATAAPASPDTPLSLPDKPSIAVLPFQNISGDPEQEYFTDGITEDIITELARFHELFVIARNGSFTYKGKAVDIKQVGRELGVRYVLEGSVRKAAGRVRITGQLIEAESGTHLWADRFDGALEDVFELQDRVTSSVVSAIAPRLDKAEIARAARKPVGSLNAYDCFLRGLAHTYVLTRESSEEGRRLFYRAIELDPEFATPYGMATRCYCNRVDQGWIVDGIWEATEVRHLAARVAAIGRDDALALCSAGYALVRVCRDYEAGEDLLDQSIAANPNMAAAWRWRGFASLFAGEHEAAIEQFGRALRLSPLDAQISGIELGMATAFLLLSKYDEALHWAKRSHRHSPNGVMNLRALAAANAFVGDLDEARRTVQKILQLSPALTLSQARASSAFRRPEDLSKWLEGIRLAGLPE